jgi:hypothetical protein
MASKLSLAYIEKETGFDFEKGAVERRKFYSEAIKDSDGSFEPFATIVLQSVGRQSLAEPLKRVGPFPCPEWIPLSAQVGIFFSAMPLTYYEMSKNIFKELTDQSSHEEDFDDLSEAESDCATEKFARISPTEAVGQETKAGICT